MHHDCRTQIFVTKEKYGVLSCIDFEDIKVEDLFVTGEVFSFKRNVNEVLYQLNQKGLPAE